MLFPFTRLVHMISGFAAPFRYLLRPGYQIVRSRRKTALPRARNVVPAANKRVKSDATPAE
jgi:nitrate reductase gamma subunit